MDECTYSPQISPGSPDVAIPDDDIVIVQRDTVLLQFPYGSPTDELELRNPELNDKIVTQVYRVQRYTRNNTLDIYRDPTWFKTGVLNWNFTGLTSDQRNDIIAFCRVSAGKYIKVTDYLSQEHKCIIINPDNPITQEHRGCSYTWKVDLQKAVV